MPQRRHIRDYKFSDGTLADFADQIVINVTRDMTDFTARGVTQNDLTDLQTLIEGFNGIKTDDELLGLITTATQAKDAVRAALTIKLRTIRGIAEETYNSTGLYRTFGFEGMTEMDDNDFHRLALRVHRVGNERQTEMEPKGLTKDMLNEVLAMASDFDAKINAITTAINNRELATQERVAAGNNLFAKANRLATTGKNLYVDTDAARYNDYLLPDDGSDGGEKPPAPPTP